MIYSILGGDVMDRSRSREALSEFLDYLAQKGLMEQATARSRKAAASKILGILEEPEASDITSIDIDDLVSRFSRLHGRDYTPQSLTTYKSRLHSSIEDFKSYLINPLGFRPSTPNRERAKPSTKEVKDNHGTKVDTAKADVPKPSSMGMAASTILPIPIRSDLTIFIQGLPFDLSEAEAKKISAVITAMAIS